MGRPGAAVAAVALAATTLLTACSDDGAQERITRYDVQVTAQLDGSVLVVESLDYDFGGQDRHGIGRSVPRRADHTQTQTAPTPWRIWSSGARRAPRSTWRPSSTAAAR